MADFLRASISHHTANIAILEDEIKLLQDYLAMQQIRFGAALDCSVNLTEDALKRYYVPSFSLQPLLENAIKHNNFTPDDPLHFSIYQLNDRLVISNNIQKKKIRVESTNSGLANLAERYRLCSGDDIIIAEDQNSFSVIIKLLNNEHRNH
jgi:LytS/YehU family sensor histidine kinase